MSESCGHDCGSCQENCAERDPHAKLGEFSSIKKVVAIMSGKGGVGKSMVTGLMAVLAQKAGLKTAILDADITGPSIPKMFGVTEKATGDENGIYPAITSTGIRVMSLNLLTARETDPVVWRGPIIAGTVKQFWTDVVWGDVDIMFVDMPPGTGDIQITLSQKLDFAGAVIVSTPQDIALIDAVKGVNMFKKVNVPILGIVENMSYYICEHCGARADIFGHEGARKTAEKLGETFLGEIPLHIAIRENSDAGTPVVYSMPGSAYANAYLAVARQIKEKLGF